ncbi:MAG: DUF4468 domain-containing protein [Tannerella sp.]|jgi:flavin reductase (DIM6/NTAB) family NADH-FMN oxidoreductase RutF|nr:DUF4468 domain-containing protein [Tannerella sp.]
MKLTFIYLLMAAMAAPIFMQAKDDAKYLAGAVPEENGKVVFSKSCDYGNLDQTAVFKLVNDWMENKAKQAGNDSRIAFADKEKGQIVATIADYIVFSNKAFSLDRTLMSYNIYAVISGSKCDFRLERIRFDYENKKYPAEEYISDEVALNNKKDGIIAGYRKFRIKAIDYVEALFESLTAQPDAIKVSSEPLDPKYTSKESASKGAVGNDVASGATQKTIAAAQEKAARADAPATAADAPAGYKKLSPDKIPGNIIKMLGDDWMLITAGNDNGFNMMTASWGGLGRLYEKPVATCFINPLRYTYQLMEKGEYYTLSFYTEAYREALQYCGSHSGRDGDKVKGSGLTPVTLPSGAKAFGEAWLILECRKLVAQSLSPDNIFDNQVKTDWAGKQLHKMYIGEIINAWVK